MRSGEEIMLCIRTLMSKKKKGRRKEGRKEGGARNPRFGSWVLHVDSLGTFFTQKMKSTMQSLQGPCEI